MIAKDPEIPWMHCDNCDRTYEARGGRTPRYCPFCGKAVLASRARAMSPRAAGPTPKLDKLAAATAVCGVLGLCLYPLAVVALLLGIIAIFSIALSRGRRGGGGLVAVGFIFALVSLGLRLLRFLAVVST